MLFGLSTGDVHDNGPLFPCPDGTMVFDTSSCPGGRPAAQSDQMTTAQQLQWEIDALWKAQLEAQAGSGMPQGSTPAPGINTGPSWGTVALVVGAVAFLMMARR